MKSSKKSTEKYVTKKEEKQEKGTGVQGTVTGITATVKEMLEIGTEIMIGIGIGIGIEKDQIETVIEIEIGVGKGIGLMTAMMKVVTDAQPKEQQELLLRLQPS
jgi:hypothetical protein